MAILPACGMAVQVIADIEKEAGSFYGQVSSRRQGSGAGKQRMQRGAPQSPGATPTRAISLEVCQ